MKLRGLRGSVLEDMINRTIADYRSKKLALIQKIPTPITPMAQDKEGHITRAFFEKKSTVDYIGLVQEIAVAFDAKESQTEKFPLKNIHEHQYQFMKEWEEQGGVAFLIILFNKELVAYYMRFSELEKFWKKKIDFKLSDLDDNYKMNVRGKIKIDIISKLQLDIDSR